MAGDLGITEWAVLEGTAPPSAAALSRQAPGPTIHRYGRVSILAVPDGAIAERVPGATELRESPDGLNEVEQLGLAALRLRESEGYQHAKRNNPPSYEPTLCRKCGKVIRLGADAYTMKDKGYYCARCSPLLR